MSDQTQSAFDPEAFLASTGLGRKIVQLKAQEIFFSQGSKADSIFYLQNGRAKLTVVTGQLDVKFTDAPPRIRDATVPSLNSDFEGHGAP